MSISVVISTKKRKEYLKDCLNSLEKQSSPPDEVIVIEDSGDEEYAERVSSEISETKRIFSVAFLYNVPSLGTTKSLNRAISFASGELVYLTDDDCILDERCLENLIGLFEEGISAVGGRVIPIENDKVYSKEVKEIGRVMPDGKIVTNFHSNPHNVLEVDFLTGGNLAFKRTCWEAQPFDERFGGNAYRYETDWCLNLPDKILYNAESIVYHRRALEGGARVDGLEWHYWYVRNHTIFLLKNFSRFWTFAFFFKMIYSLARGRNMSSRYKIFQTGTKRQILRKLLSGYFSGIKVMMK